MIMFRCFHSLNRMVFFGNYEGQKVFVHIDGGEQRPILIPQDVYQIDYVNYTYDHTIIYANNYQKVLLAYYEEYRLITVDLTQSILLDETYTIDQSKVKANALIHTTQETYLLDLETNNFKPLSSFSSTLSYQDYIYLSDQISQPFGFKRIYYV